MKRIWNWYYGKASIHKKIMISCQILVFIPIIILGIYSYQVSRNNLLSQTRQTMESNVESMSYNMDNDISRENDNIKFWSYNSRLRERLANGLEDTNDLALELNESIEPTFWYFIASDNNLKGIEIYSPYIRQEIGKFLKPMNSQEEKEWFEENYRNFRTQWRVEEGGIYATRMILDASTSSTAIGYIQIEVFADRFVEKIFQTRYLNNGVLLLDQEGNIIDGRSITDKELDQEIRETFDVNEEEQNLETSDFLLTSKTLDNHWRLYYYIDKNEISEQNKEILFTTLLVMAAGFAVSALLMRIIAEILSKRILGLKSGAEEVSKGNFDIQIEQGYTDEIGIVAESFENMCVRIRQMMDEMYLLGMEKRKEELKALQAMMNPHFLYNCLSSIKWKAIRSGQDDIAEITSLLAVFYRTALNGGKQITTVQNELDNIKAYVQIQLISHENSFEVQYDLSDQGREYNMPNFLLQPIVENAICHGADACEEEKGIIQIQYKCEKEELIFAVYNNGPKISEGELQRILNTPGKGYGLYNIRERIRMYYGEGYGIESSITQDGRVCFAIRIKNNLQMQD